DVVPDPPRLDDAPDADPPPPRRRRMPILLGWVLVGVLVIGTAVGIAAAVRSWPRPKPAEVLKPDRGDPSPATPPRTVNPVTVPPGVPPPITPHRAGDRVDVEVAPGVRMAFCWVPPGTA